MACFGEPMGLRFGLEDATVTPKRKFRWLFKIRGVSAQDYGGQVRALPHRRGARPSLGWKEYECAHLNETIFFPFKPEWKPVQLHLFDIRCGQNPVYDWLRLNEQFFLGASGTNGTGGIYDPQSGTWRPVVDGELKRNAQLLILGGCGETLEVWTFENCYPQNIEWGELDMDNSDLITVDLTLRYDRAFFTGTNAGGGGNNNNGVPGFSPLPPLQNPVAGPGFSPLPPLQNPIAG